MLRFRAPGGPSAGRGVFWRLGIGEHVMRSFGRLPLMTVAVLGVVVLGRPVLAQDAIYNEAPTRDDFICALSAPAAAPDLPTQGAPRGLSLRSAPDTAPAPPTGPPARPNVGA